MSNLSNFKIAVLSIFGFSIIIGIAVFALSKNNSFKKNAAISVWGTIPSDDFDALYNNSTLKKSETITVSYTKKDQADFDQDFIEALAEGKGPDIVIIREDNLYKHRNKLFVIPYESISERSFKDKFIEEGELFLGKEGVSAIPLMVDPMVMYWNRDIFSNNVESQPPQYWDQIYPLIEKVTKKDSSGNILQSTIALGEWRNITNSKEILAMLFLQAGTPITNRLNGNVVSVINSSFNSSISPSDSTLNFYTQFSNPTSNTYSWNRSLPTSLNMFLGGNLAVYFGFASELFSIQQKNPNLNFDVTNVPQTRNTARKTVFGHMYAMAITKQSQNIAPAFTVIAGFSEVSALKALEKITNLPPVRRDMLSEKPTDAYRSVFYTSALISRSWIDPDATGSSETFRNMVESITSGKTRITEALNRANQELNDLLK